MSRLLACGILTAFVFGLGACGQSSLHQIAEDPCAANGCPVDVDPGGSPTRDPTDDPTPPPAMSVAGSWATSYDFDLSDYLGPLAGLGSQIDIVNQIVSGDNVISDLPIPTALLQEIVSAYLPDWFPALVSILDNVIHIFQDVRIQGQLQLHQTNGTAITLAGVEQWTAGVVRVIEQCPLGEADPGYPACADVAVAFNQVLPGYASVGAAPQAFTGTLSGTAVSFAGRRVDMQISAFVLAILDQLAQVATAGEHATLTAALNSLIDCDGLTAGLEGILCTTFGSCSPLPSVVTACVGARNLVVAELTTQLTSIDVDWEMMAFDQRAQLFDGASGTPASYLGGPSHTPGDIENGTFDVLIGADLVGSWAGTRAP